MANLQRIDDTEVMIGNIPDITLVDGKLTEPMAKSLGTALRDAIRKINGLISHGSAIHGHRGNIDECHVDVVFPGTADTEVAVPHTLERVPAAVTQVRADRACITYDSSSGSWTDKLLYVKNNTANATVRLRID